MKFLRFLVPLLIAPAAAAITRTWDGGGGTANFNNAANWNPDGVPASGDDLAFGSTAPSTVTNDLTGRTFGSISINRGLTLEGNAFTLTGGISSTPAVLGAPVIIAANVTLGASQNFTSGGGAISTLTFSGNVTFGAHTLTLAGSRSTTFAGITGSSTAGSQFIKSGTGPLRFDTSAIFVTNQPFTLSAGSLDVDGFFQTPLIMTGGTLTGDGSLGEGLDASGGDIVPDAGDLSVSGATLLHGSVNLRVALLGPSDETALECSGGAVTIQDNATLEVVSTAYTPIRGDGFLILSKSTAGSISGTFNNVSEAAEIQSGTSIVRASYVGGNGNDLFLTTSSVTRTWDGGATLNDNWTDATNWIGNIAPDTGDVLVFPPGIDGTDRGMDNDFPNDKTFRQIIFNGEDFTVRGNRFRLSHGIHLGFNSGHTNIDTDVVLTRDQSFFFGSITSSTFDRFLHFDAADSIDTNGHILTLDGAGAMDGKITGAGSLRLAPGAVVRVRSDSDYTGFTLIEPTGELFVDKDLSQLGSEIRLGTTASGSTVRGALQIENNEAVGTCFVREALRFEQDSRLISNGLGVEVTSLTDYAGNIEMAGSGVELSLIAGAHHHITGRISGPGDFTIRDGREGSFTSFWSLRGPVSNTFTGRLSVIEGYVRLEKSAPGILAVSGDELLVEGSNEGGFIRHSILETRENEQIADDCHVIVAHQGELRIGYDLERTETIGDLTLDFNAQVLSGHPSATGKLVLKGDLQSIGAASSIFTTLAVSKPSTEIHVESALITAALELAPSPGNGSIRKTGEGVMRIKGPAALRIEVAEGEVSVDNTATPVITLNGGIFSGRGSGSITSLAAGGTLSPGNVLANPVIFSAGPLALNSATTCRFDVTDATAGTGHDQISVTGFCAINGATLELQPSAGFNVPLGSQITLVANDGTDAVTGAFAGLPEGAFLLFGGGTSGFVITYQGGTGNDVVLRRVAFQPVIPELTSLSISRGTGSGGQDQLSFIGIAEPSAELDLLSSSDLVIWTVQQVITANAEGKVTVTINRSSGQPSLFFRVRRRLP